MLKNLPVYQEIPKIEKTIYTLVKLIQIFPLLEYQISEWLVQFNSLL